MNVYLITDYRYSLNELESMIPWEREVYFSLINQKIEADNKRMEELRKKIQ